MDDFRELAIRFIKGNEYAIKQNDPALESNLGLILERTYLQGKKDEKIKIDHIMRTSNDYDSTR
jgi:hypothetical protein